MKKYALDTNMISYALKRQRGAKEKLLQTMRNHYSLAIPSVAYFEVRCWLIESGATVKAREFDQLCNAFPVTDMTKNDWEKAAQIRVYLRSKGLTIGDADILIAAFCIIHDYVLVTNDDHFSRIPELKCENWASEGEQ